MYDQGMGMMPMVADAAAATAFNNGAMFYPAHMAAQQAMMQPVSERPRNNLEIPIVSGGVTVF